MVVDDLDMACVAIDPDETQAPLTVESNAVLIRSVSTQSFQAVTRRHAQKLQRRGCMQLLQLANGDGCDVGEPGDTATVEQGFGITAIKTLNHEKIITNGVINVKRYCLINPIDDLTHEGRPAVGLSLISAPS
jgi:hypothetical protein